MKAQQKKVPYPPIGQEPSLQALKSHAYRQAPVREPQTSLNLSVVQQRIAYQPKFVYYEVQNCFLHLRVRGCERSVGQVNAYVTLCLP
nr:MAG TPA: hypothetical protein [Caudoviricetes sp.]